MMSPSPNPLSPSKRRVRQSRVARLAKSFGFLGRIEYRHVYSQSGGAQYGRGPTVEEDILTVYAEAFERDANPDDFSLAAIIAHERGHQLLARHPRIGPRLGAGITLAAEEVLASLIGSMVCGAGRDRDSLVSKATAERLQRGPHQKMRCVSFLISWNYSENIYDGSQDGERDSRGTGGCSVRPRWSPRKAAHGR